MQNWAQLLGHTFWLTGAASILAHFSYQYWHIGAKTQLIRSLLRQPAWPFWLGMALISVGLALVSVGRWEIIIWIGAAGISGAGFIGAVGRLKM